MKKRDASSVRPKGPKTEAQRAEVGGYGSWAKGTEPPLTS